MTEHKRIALRTRCIPPLWPIASYWSWNLGQTIGVSKGETISIWQRGDYTALWEEDAISRLGNYAVDTLRARSHELDKVRQEGIAAGETVIAYCEDFVRDLPSKNLADVGQFLVGFRRHYEAFTQANMLYWLFSPEIVQEQIRRQLGEREDFDELFAALSMPTTSTYSQIEEDDFADLVRLARQKGIEHDDTAKAIATFSAKYIWFPFEYCGPAVWDETAVRQRLAEAMHKPDHAERGRGQANISVPAPVEELFAVLRTMALMQDDRKMLNAKICYLLNGKIFGQVAKQLGVPIEQAWMIEETLLAEAQGDELRSRLAEREKLTVLAQSDGHQEIYEGAAAMEYLQREGIELPGGDLQADTVHGQCASKGVARGVARVLRTSSYNGEFNDDDILVSGMTTPDYVVFMKKAGAIVTDEGGITCHAAIVSRELGKPCVIGTKVATRVLKTGDLVEVDATNGMVTKL